MDISKAYPNPVNRDLLFEELVLAGFPSLSFSDSGLVVHNVTAQNEATINAVIAAHNANALTTEQSHKAEQSTILDKANLALQYLPDIRKLLNALIDIDIVNTADTAQAFEAITTIMANDVSSAFRNRFYGALAREQNISLLGLNLVQILALTLGQKRTILTYLRIFLTEYAQLALFAMLK